MNKKSYLIFFILILTCIKIYPESTFVSPRYLENADQFDETEGVRTHTQSPSGLKNEVKGNDDTGGVEVDTGSKSTQQKKQTKSSFGPSFSDMASDVQGAKKLSGTSFGDLAKAARGGKQKQEIAITTQNRNAIDRLFSPGTAAPQPKQKAQPAKKQPQWGNEL